VKIEDETPVDDPPVAGKEGDDVQLARALEVLKSWTYFERLRGDPAQMQARAPEPGTPAP